MGTEINLNIRCYNGNKFSVRATLPSTVRAFKHLLAQNCDVPANEQRLICNKGILRDDQTLESYGLKADQTIRMVRVSTAPGLGSGELTGFEQVERLLAQNPNMLRDMMKMPSVRILLNNPEIMRGMIMSIPQMREIIDQNPKLAHILNDPAVFRRTLETGRNPELMREKKRNIDRVMSNCESTFEKFDMLSRMYVKGRDLFRNATTMGENDSGLQADHRIHRVSGANMMTDTMNMPLIQNLLNNPEIMLGMFMNNPHMREIIDPAILNDPAILKQAVEAARDPELMREMMRTVMSIVESSPEGFNMFRLMYENVQQLFPVTRKRKRTRLSIDSTPPPPELFEPSEPSSPLPFEDMLDMHKMYLSHVSRRWANVEEGKPQDCSTGDSAHPELEHIEQHLAAAKQIVADLQQLAGNFRKLATDLKQRVTDLEQHATDTVACAMMVMIVAFGGAVPPSV